MKREELMINDMVFDYTNSPVKVCAVGQDIVVKNRFRIGSLEPNELSPIPLTEEILVKNGFHTYGESYFIPEDKCNAHVRIGFHKRETVVDLHRHGAFSVQISCKPGKLYIHQLQRLLNLCNIDKEIIL